MDIKELQSKYNDSCIKVEKRKTLTLKYIKSAGRNLDGIMEDFYKVITDTKGCINGSASLQSIREKYFPEEGKWAINDVIDSLYKLRDLTATNFNWKVKLDKAINEESEEKVEVIWDFLQRWKENAREWFIENAHRYIDLKKNFDKAEEEFKQTESYKKAEEEDKNCTYWNRKTRRLLIEWEKDYYSDIHSWTREIVNVYKSYTNIYTIEDTIAKESEKWHESINEELLNKKLDKEVKAKYKDLIDRITAVVGKITDAHLLTIGRKGDINGIIIGDCGKANIETIGAGGYNIQCFHFRTLIHKIK